MSEENRDANQPTLEMATLLPSDTRIDVGAQLISLEPGLFSVSVVAPLEVRTEGGMVLPCIRLDTLQRADLGQAYVSTMSETALLMPSSPTAYLRIVGARTSVLLTTYRASHAMAPPEIHIRIVDPPVAAVSDEVRADENKLAAAPLIVLVHVQSYGDLKFPDGEWAGAAAGDQAIEGFAITLRPDMPRGLLQYQAILGRDWETPWMDEGEFCGSRQMGLSLLGVKVRLCGSQADEYSCQIWGRFNGVDHGPFESGETCQADDYVLCGLRIELTPSKVEPVIKSQPT